MSGFTFGQVEAVLASAHLIAPDKRAAFVSRIKNLQKHGLPHGDRPGRGRASLFSFAQLMQMAVGLDLIAAGVSPQAASDLVLRYWGACLFGIKDGLNDDAEFGWDWVVMPDQLADLRVPDMVLLPEVHPIYYKKNTPRSHPMIGNKSLVQVLSPYIVIEGSINAAFIAHKAAEFMPDRDEMRDSIEADISNFYSNIEVMRNKLDGMLGQLATVKQRKDAAKILYSDKLFPRPLVRNLSDDEIDQAIQTLEPETKDFILRRSSKIWDVSEVVFTELLFTYVLIAAPGGRFRYSGEFYRFYEALKTEVDNVSPEA